MAIFYEDRVNDLKLWRRNTLSFLPHFHDSIEVVYMLSGEAHAIIDGKEYIINGGSVCMSLPNVIHSYDEKESVDAILMIIPRIYASSFSGIIDKFTVATPVISDESGKILSFIKTVIDKNKKNSRFKKQFLNGYFSIIFAEIFEKAGIVEKKAVPETERRILTYCLENYKHDISLDLLEKELNISKNHISFIFSSKLKVSLPDFLGSLRIAEAKRLIQNGESMTEAALGSGFASIRTFNRRFLSETGKTPREFAKQIKQDAF